MAKKNKLQVKYIETKAVANVQAVAPVALDPSPLTVISFS